MAKEQNQKPVHCPSCNQPALRQGNEIVCELCDAVFKITKSDGARVKKIGTIEDLQGRIAKMEAEIFPSKPEPEPEPEPDNEDGW